MLSANVFDGYKTFLMALLGFGTVANLKENFPNISAMFRLRRKQFLESEGCQADLNRALEAAQNNLVLS